MKLKELTVHEYCLFVENTTYKTIIYGAGCEGIRLAEELNKVGILVECFCDRDVNKSGSMIDGIPVVTPNDLVCRQIEFCLLLSITSDKYPIDSLMEDIKLNIFDIINMQDATIYKVSNQQQHMAFRSIKEYNDTNQWFEPLCYDRVDDFSSEYMQELKKSAVKITIKNGVQRAVDQQSKYINVENGTRVTQLGKISVGEEKKSRIYFIGDSRAFGAHVEDKHTIESFLQRRIGQSSVIVNQGSTMFTMYSLYRHVKLLDLKQGDMVFACCLLIFYSLRGDGLQLSKTETTYLYASYLNMINDYCRNKSVQFTFFHIPYLDELGELSIVEQYINGIRRMVSEEDLRLFYGEKGLRRFQTQRIDLIVDKELLFTLLQSNGIQYIDFTQYLSRPHNFGETYVDSFHLSPNGNKAVADKIYEFIKSKHCFKQPELEERQNKYSDTFIATLMQAYDTDEYINYLKGYHTDAGIKGCAVMNCNPFTNGHKFLIEYAAKLVDILYVFVLQEDSSRFPFEDRIDLVKKGVEKLENVIVLKSGMFMISQLTMPEYFDKDIKQDIKIDCTDDLLLFCNKIAPTLNITKRFAGAEPYCNITNQYNSQMGEMLPEFGVEFIKVERLEDLYEPISASKVRRLLEQGNLDAIRGMVPETTYTYLECWYSKH